MYIDPFVGGVLATLFTEAILFVAAGITYSIKSNKKQGK